MASRRADLDYCDLVPCKSSAVKSKTIDVHQTEGEYEMNLILLVILVILLVGALPTWPYSGGWGYYPSGAIGTILIIVLILALLGRI
jgi:hypothetical protein